MTSKPAKKPAVKRVPAKKSPRQKVGRPTLYKPEYCQQIVEFFDVEPVKTIELITTDKRTGRKYANQELQGVRLPTMERFAHLLNVNTDTLVEWSKVHPEFSAAYMRGKQIQKEILVSNGLLGLYNGSFAQFVARNFTDMEDRTITDVNMPQPLLGGSTVLQKAKAADEEK